VKDASTVMVLRDTDRGPEVFAARRVQGMAFAGGMTVFPGGGVDAAGGDPDVAWSGPAPHWWAKRLSCDVPRARRLVCAAARETFEECGVLLADHVDGSPVADAGRYHASRESLESHEMAFSGFLARESLSLAAGRLRPFDHWVTPAVEQRRGDQRVLCPAIPQARRRAPAAYRPVRPPGRRAAPFRLPLVPRSALAPTRAGRPELRGRPDHVGAPGRPPAVAQRGRDDAGSARV